MGMATDEKRKRVASKRYEGSLTGSEHGKRIEKEIKDSNKKRKRKSKCIVEPSSKINKDLDVGMKFELFWEPTQSWSSSEIKWNWNDGSYVIQCEDDINDTPLTYYINQYKYRYDVDLDDDESEKSKLPPKKKRKSKEKKSKSEKKKKVKKEKQAKPEKAKVTTRKPRTKKRPKKKTIKKKIVIRKEPNYSRLRIEKLFDDEKDAIEGIENSFMDFDDKVNELYGLRRSALDSFRAVNISDERLLKRLFLNKKKVPNPWLNWSVNVKTNCLDLAIKKNDYSMCQILLKYKRKQTKYAYNRVSLPMNRLKVSSGRIGAATFGHKIRSVKASRGE